MCLLRTFFLLAGALAVWAISNCAMAAPIRFDFGNGDVDANTGVPANFVIAEEAPLGVEAETIDGVTLTLTPIVGTGADFASSQWGANSQGIGVRSLDASGATVESGGSGTRRRIDGGIGEAVQFSFDATMTIDSIRLGSFVDAGDGTQEVVEIQFVSGTDPFGGGSFSFLSEASTAPTTDLPVGVSVEAGTVLRLIATTSLGGGVLWNDIVATVVPEPGAAVLALLLLGCAALPTKRARNA